jgi:metal-sulfur cluster biosynthetic enzyme
MNTTSPDHARDGAPASPPSVSAADPVKPTNAGEASASPSSPPAGITEELVWATLRNCYDPEIPVNIVDLGLIYDVSLKGNRVDVKMTLTAPGCHLGGMIAGDVQSKLLAMEGVDEANVELVWDPPWHQSMITAAGRRILGME